MNDPWLILHAGALGDLVLSIQLALQAGLARHTGRLDVLSRTDIGELSSCNPSISRRSIEGFETHWLYAIEDDSPPEKLRNVLENRSVLSLLGGSESAVHRRLLQCGCRTVLRIDPRPGSSSQHILDQWQTQLSAQGFLIARCAQKERSKHRLFLPDKFRDQARVTLRHSTGIIGPVVVIHPGSGGRAKCWPLRCFRELAAAIAETGRTAVFVLGPVELERWDPADIGALSASFPTLQLTAPSDLVGLIAGTDALVCNDSGPGHLAALLGTPVVNIFGPTSAAVWGPRSNEAVSIQGDSEVSGNWGIQVPAIVKLLDGLIPRD